MLTINRSNYGVEMKETCVLRLEKSGSTLLFFTFNVLVVSPKNYQVLYSYMLANPARGLLNRENTKYNKHHVTRLHA